MVNVSASFPLRFSGVGWGCEERLLLADLELLLWDILEEEGSGVVCLALRRRNLFQREN